MIVPGFVTVPASVFVLPFSKRRAVAALPRVIPVSVLPDVARNDPVPLVRSVPPVTAAPEKFTTELFCASIVPPVLVKVLPESVRMPPPEARNVPVGLGFIDYGRRECGIGGYLDLTGDVEADMARIAAFYADRRGRRPELAGVIRLDAGPTTSASRRERDSPPAP